MGAEKQDIQEDFLGALVREGRTISIFLVNGIRLNGRVHSYDQYVVCLKDSRGEQMVYKHAISTVVPQEAGQGEPAAGPSRAAPKKLTVTRN